MPFQRTLAFILLFVFPVISPAADDEDFDTQMMRATVKISHDQSTATGFILSTAGGAKFVLVTAAHVLEKTPGDETSVIFRRRQDEGVYRKEPSRLAIRKSGTPLWTQHPTEDIAVISISPPAQCDLSAIPQDWLATDDVLRLKRVHPGQLLSCLGYPHRNEANDAGFAILRGGPIGSFPLVPAARNKTFYVSMHTFEGDSGGPVYLSLPGRTTSDPETRLILGLVSGQLFLDEEARMIYGTTKLRHRLGLGIVIQAAFIKETLERLPAAER